MFHFWKDILKENGIDYFGFYRTNTLLADDLAKFGYPYKIIISDLADRGIPMADIADSDIHQFGDYTGWFSLESGTNLFFKTELDAIMAKMIFS